MIKIEVEIKSIDNGWIVDDSYYHDETYFKKYDDAATFAKKIFTRYKRDECL